MPRPKLRNTVWGLVLAPMLACSDDVQAPTRSSQQAAGSAQSGAGPAAAGGAPVVPNAPGAAGVPGISGTPATAGSPANVGSAGRAGAAPPTSGFAGMPMTGGAARAGTSALAGRAGVGSGTGGVPASAAGTAAAAGGGATGDPFAAERQACLDSINMYRATLMLAPLKRGTPEQETCSDDGAKRDGDSGQAHGSAGSCRGLGGQNTCPGYPVRPGGTLTDTLNGCLMQMWAEGEPANGVDACIADRTGCFLMHGHWINMSLARYTTVACGFYKMSNGRFWMNQNFGY